MTITIMLNSFTIDTGLAAFFVGFGFALGIITHMFWRTK